MCGLFIELKVLEGGGGIIIYSSFLKILNSDLLFQLQMITLTICGNILTKNILNKISFPFFFSKILLQINGIRNNTHLKINMHNKLNDLISRYTISQDDYEARERCSLKKERQREIVFHSLYLCMKLRNLIYIK